MIAPNFSLRVNFTHEDKAAKGLRSLREPQTAPEPPVYFTAREAVGMFPRLLLLGERGAGKSVFGRQLAAETGAYLADLTDGSVTLPADGLVILDGIDRISEADLLAMLGQLGDRPVVLLGDGAVVKGWRIPSGIAVHSLMPLDAAERAAFVETNAPQARAALSDAAANPALFALALTVNEPVTSAEELVDAWRNEAPERAETGFNVLRTGTSINRAIDGLLAAQHLATLDDEATAELFLNDPFVWTPSLASLLRRMPERAATLAPLLMAGDSDAALRGALLIADVIPNDPDVLARLQSLIETGRLAPMDRDRAARVLSANGDLRDFDALCAVPAGSVTMGSTSHPNSQPVHIVELEPFSIGRYPVTNALYARFIAATGRKWASPNADNPERRNVPATDLTWRDARAYCDWLTGQWRAAGRITAAQIVRLPTEPEWERASRGDMPDGGDDIVYPWGKGWNSDAANSEESGFNAPCATGLFPAGQSPYGCLDMAGQVWEWTTTLWGDDMATPSFTYPYADDGREDPDAGPTIRRVLRGGCFSSTSLKACCSYRGSLEPDGFWRGNGFRIVVSPKRI
jgi:iron(II)-dependent oxidoreductase